MIGGLHWTSWLLLVAAIGPGLTIVTIYYFKRRNARKDG